MNSRHFIMATAGHVDHGKSSLVKALTGTDPDRLPEEQARGITIVLGFAHLSLPPSSDSASHVTFEVGIVDVPGHEDFVKNMVAGVGSINLALFVVAADDGWMPQTEEHLQILHYLGVERAVVALTKADLIPAGIEDVKNGIAAKLAGTPFANAPIIPTSVVQGSGIAELRTALSEVLTQTPPPRDMAKPRLPVDRVFVLKGIGTVITGTLTGGSFARGQEIAVQPGGGRTKIRSLQNHNRDVAVAVPGMRTALNLSDLAASSKGSGPADAQSIQRGDVLTLPGLGSTSDTLDVWLEKSVRLRGGKSPASKPLKDGLLVRVHHGSGNASARVILFERKELGPGESALAQLRFDHPLFVFGGDRFILRDWAEQFTLAGGIVLDAEATRRASRDPARQKFLLERCAAIGDLRVWVCTQVERDRAARAAALLANAGFSSADVAHELDALVAERKFVRLGPFVADGAWWTALQQQATQAVDAEHRAHPQNPGLDLNQLRAAIEDQLPFPELFDLLVLELGKTGFTQVGTHLKRGTHRPALPAHLQAAGDRLRQALSAKPLEPPSRKELAPDPLSQQALRFLLQTKEATELNDEAVLLTDAFEAMKRNIIAHVKAKGPATASDLRQAVGTTRRILIPLLEKLDKDGVTRRDGDKRVLR